MNKRLGRVSSCVVKLNWNWQRLRTTATMWPMALRCSWVTLKSHLGSAHCSDRAASSGSLRASAESKGKVWPHLCGDSACWKGVCGTTRCQSTLRRAESSSFWMDFDWMRDLLQLCFWQQATSTEWELCWTPSKSNTLLAFQSQGCHSSAVAQLLHTSVSTSLAKVVEPGTPLWTRRRLSLTRPRRLSMRPGKQMPKL